MDPSKKAKDTAEDKSLEVNLMNRSSELRGVRDDNSITRFNQSRELGLELYTIQDSERSDNVERGEGVSTVQSHNEDWIDSSLG